MTLLRKHIDGTWHTTETFYRNRKLMVKMQKSKGAKIHVFHINSDKVDFTLRFSFITRDKLVQKAKDKIDRMELLYEAWAYCDKEDKSTEFMLQYMQDAVNVNLDFVLNFISKYSEHRDGWYKIRK